MEYKVYQVRLTAVEVDTVNTKGHDSVARHRRNLDLTCAYNKTEDQKKAMVTEAWYEGDYDPVGKVYARDLNEVFEVQHPDKFFELLKQNRVLVQRHERKEKIESLINQASKSENSSVQ